MESLTILEQIEKCDKLMKKQTEEYKNAMEFYNGLDVSSHKLLAELALTYTVCMAYISVASDTYQVTYNFKHCNLSDIESILTKAGYIEQPEKSR